MAPSKTATHSMIEGQTQIICATRPHPTAEKMGSASTNDQAMHPVLRKQCCVVISHLDQEKQERDTGTVGECSSSTNRYIWNAKHGKVKQVESKENQASLTRDYRRRILVNKRLLKDSLEPKAIEEALIVKKILNGNELEKILIPKSREDRVYSLVRTLQHKDYDVISEFVTVLQENGHSQLASVINSTYTDSSGQPTVRDIIMKVQLLYDDTIHEVPTSLWPVFSGNSALMKVIRQRYGVTLRALPEPGPRSPLVLRLQKTEVYGAEKFQTDLLSFKVAALFKDHLLEYGQSCEGRVILDVDLSDLSSHACDKYSLKRLRNLSSDSGFAEEDCECDGDGSCIIPLFKNREEGRCHDESLTKDWHKQLIAMVTHYSLVNGKKQYCVMASEIRRDILLQRHLVSISVIRMQVPVTVLHQVVIEGRLDVLQVLFECGTLHELVDCKVTSQKSLYNNKTAEEIASLPQHSAMMAPLQSLLLEEQQMPWLHRCLRMGDVNGARILMDRHPDHLLKTDSMGGLPLYWAIVGGCAELVHMVLKATSTDDVLDIGRKDQARTAVCLAASRSRADVIPVLIKYGADPNSNGSGSKKPLEYAIQEKDVKTICVLLKAGASLPSHALSQSVNTGHMGTFDVILNEESDVNRQDNKGMNALLYAARGGHVRMVRKLLEMGADLRCTNKQQRNVFHAAVESGSVPVLQKVIHESRVQHCMKDLINSQDRYVGQERCVVVRGRDGGLPAFHYIECHRWFMSVFSAALQMGGTLDVADYGTRVMSGWGTSPTSEYVDRANHRYDIAKVTADANHPLDLTPLNLLCMSPSSVKSTKMTEVLLQALAKEGLSLDIPDCFGLTPMHMAAMRGSLGGMKVLWKHGADHTLISFEGHSVAAVAELNNHPMAANYITGHDLINSDTIPQFLADLEAAKDALQSAALKELWSKGMPIARHVVQTVRPLEEALNNLLFEMGASTIQAETGSTGMPTETPQRMPSVEPQLSKPKQDRQESRLRRPNSMPSVEPQLS